MSDPIYTPILALRQLLLTCTPLSSYPALCDLTVGYLDSRPSRLLSSIIIIATETPATTPSVGVIDCSKLREKKIKRTCTDVDVVQVGANRFPIGHITRGVSTFGGTRLTLVRTVTDKWEKPFVLGSRVYCYCREHLTLSHFDCSSSSSPAEQKVYDQPLVRLATGPWISTLLDRQRELMIPCRNILYARRTSSKYARVLVPTMGAIHPNVVTLLNVTNCFTRDGKLLAVPNDLAVADHDEGRIYYISEHPTKSEFFNVIEAPTTDTTQLKSHPMASLPPFKVGKIKKSTVASLYTSDIDDGKVLGSTVCKGIVTVLRKGRIDRWDPLTDEWTTQLVTGDFKQTDSQLLASI